MSADAATVRIRVDDLTLCYNGRPVIDGLTWELAPGDFVAVLGPNGCGKTTLLRALHGYLAPRSGAVFVGGVNVRQMPATERAQAIAATQQEDEVRFEFTVGEVVAMGRTPHLGRMGSLSSNDQRVIADCLQWMELVSLRDRPITALSGGERRRVMIARALAQQPRILLLDEPGANLDLRYQHQLMTLLRQLSRTGIAVVVSMHQINLAAAFANTILLLAPTGKLHSFGAPDDVITRENIEEVYSTPVQLVSHPKSGRPQIVPIASCDK